MLEILLGQIPEAIFFALFLIFAKGLKEKRVLFTCIMVIEYLLLLHTFQYNFIFHISFMFVTYIVLKLLYKQRAQITDVFILLIAYIVMILISLVTYPLIPINYILAVIINRIIMIVFIFIFQNKLGYIQTIYKKFWNRNDKRPKAMKSITFRCINVIAFNVIFYALNLFMLYVIYYNNLK